MSDSRARIAVVGAGLSGLTCASTLGRKGFQVDVFEKSRGPGGRMSTRRREEQTFDHGAQYFRAHSEAFLKQVERWEEAGWVSQWNGRFGILTEEEVLVDSDDRVRWVGAPKMNAVARGLADGLKVSWQSRVVGLHRQAGGWSLRMEEGGVSEAYDGVVLSCPGPQAAAICPVDSSVHARARSLGYAPCWALMAEFDERLSVEFDGIRAGGDLGWMARDSSKPGRPNGERWVIHASPEFSKKHVEASREEVGDRLMAQFTSLFGGECTHLQVHRWLYALADSPTGSAFEWDSDRRIGLIGDALVGARVEAAWQSGRQMAESILQESAS